MHIRRDNAVTSSISQTDGLKKIRGWRADFSMNKGLYLLAIPIFLYFLIFCYLPMFGLVMSFQNYKPQLGVLGSDWVGLRNFIDFFGKPDFLKILRNTLVISFLGLAIGFPASIIYALLLNEMHVKWFRKSVQTIHVLPYFVSMVVICGLIIEFCASNGIITNLLVNLFGMQRENLLQNASYFWWINLFSDIWQGLGYGAIFFVSAIASVSQDLHEAATIDGAGRLRRAWHITLPGIMPAIVTMLVLRCGMLMQVGGDKILLLYNPSIYETADVISTHVQRMGIEKMQYGYSTAVGLFNSVVGTMLLIISNNASRRLTDTSIM